MDRSVRLAEYNNNERGGGEELSPEGGQSDSMRSFDCLYGVWITEQSTNVLIDRSLLLILVSPVSDHVMNSCPLHIMLMQSEALLFLASHPRLAGVRRTYGNPRSERAVLRLLSQTVLAPLQLSPFVRMSEQSNSRISATANSSAEICEQLRLTFLLTVSMQARLCSRWIVL